MLDVTVNSDYTVSFGDRFRLSLQRTIRIPDDGKTYPLPPSMGAFELAKVADYAESLPAAWVEAGGVFIAMYQFEALWLAFEATAYKPNAVQVWVGGVNVVDGSVSAELTQSPQNYMVAPPQPWLDGINIDEETVRQFVAVPLGTGHSVEAQVKGSESLGGIQVRVYEPTAGIFANKAARSMTLSNPFEGMDDEEESFSPSQQMGVGAGGQMTQRIYDDPYGRSVWDDANYGELNIFIVNSEQYAAITNKPAPPTPMSAELYTIYGFPWFKMFDDEIASVAGCEPLNAVRSVQSIVKESGEATIDDDSSLVDELNVTSIDADFVTKGRGKKQSPDKPEQ